MRSFITYQIPDRLSCLQIGYDQISPSASSTRDLSRRLHKGPKMPHLPSYLQPRVYLYANVAKPSLPYI